MDWMESTGRGLLCHDLGDEVVGVVTGFVV